jgi:hypothetical protein
MQKPQGPDGRLPPPRLLILDFTTTHVLKVRDLTCTLLGQLTHTRQSDGVLHPDCVLMSVTTSKLLHHHKTYLDHPNPITFLP